MTNLHTDMSTGNKGEPIKSASVSEVKKRRRTERRKTS